MGTVIDVVLVAAVAENGVIGRSNGLPWRLKSDMAHFRALTMGKPVVMGRKTFLSIGRALPHRTTIVVSRDRRFAAPGIVVAPTLDFAFAAARGDALRRGADAIVIAGGAQIYAQSMERATRLAVTQVHVRAEGDAHFPVIDPQLWQETARADHQPGPDDDTAFSLIDFERRAPAGRRRLPGVDGKLLAGK
jgi:dihydrofolate reductase